MCKTRNKKVTFVECGAIKCHLNNKVLLQILFIKYKKLQNNKSVTYICYKMYAL